MSKFKFLLLFFFSMYGMKPEDAQISENTSQLSVPKLVNICLKRIRNSCLEQFQKKFPVLPQELDDRVKEDIISDFIFPLSKITDITLEEHDTSFGHWPDCLILKDRLLMLQCNLNDIPLLTMPKNIRAKYFDLEQKCQITEEIFTQAKEEQNKGEDRLWNIKKENNFLVLCYKNATIATKKITLHTQSQILFWDNKTISVLQKKNDHVFLLFYDLSPLANLAATLANLKNYPQALLLKTIIEKSKQGYFFDLTDELYKSIYEAMPQEIKSIITTLKTKQ